MKKILFTTLLLFSIGFAPCLCGRIEFQIPVADLAAVLVRPLASALFWDAWDVVFDRVLARSLPVSLPAQQNSCSVVSISQLFVRRVNRSRNFRRGGRFSQLPPPTKNSVRESNQQQEN